MKKEKAKYESPFTRKTLVSLESCICAGSTDFENPNDSKAGQIEEHQVNTDFGFDYSQQEWE